MSLPRWWPRTRCVYCGARTDERPPEGAPEYARFRRHRLTCWRHVSLVALDPEYSGG